MSSTINCYLMPSRPPGSAGRPPHFTLGVGLCLLFALLLSSCSEGTPTAGDAATQSAEPPAIRLYAFDGGHFTLNDVRVFSPPYPDTVNPVTIGNPCFLLVHPRGQVYRISGCLHLLRTRSAGSGTARGRAPCTA